MKRRRSTIPGAQDLNFFSMKPRCTTIHSYYCIQRTQFTFNHIRKRKKQTPHVVHALQAIKFRISNKIWPKSMIKKWVPKFKDSMLQNFHLFNIVLHLLSNISRKTCSNH
uniref:Uncharacterized protein n=1 Tax=Rhizophora mucronata TaxID=61149 RepID=A0A2P2J6A1_RHIMU